MVELKVENRFLGQIISVAAAYLVKEERKRLLEHTGGSWRQRRFGFLELYREFEVHPGTAHALCERLWGGDDIAFPEQSLREWELKGAWIDSDEVEKSTPDFRRITGVVVFGNEDRQKMFWKILKVYLPYHIQENGRLVLDCFPFVSDLGKIYADDANMRKVAEEHIAELPGTP